MSEIVYLGESRQKKGAPEGVVPGSLTAFNRRTLRSYLASLNTTVGEIGRHLAVGATGMAFQPLS